MLVFQFDQIVLLYPPSWDIFVFHLLMIATTMAATTNVAATNVLRLSISHVSLTKSLALDAGSQHFAGKAAVAAKVKRNLFKFLEFKLLVHR